MDWKNYFKRIEKKEKERDGEKENWQKKRRCSYISKQAQESEKKHLNWKAWN